MDLLKLGAQMFMNQLGSKSQGLDIGQVVGALQGLLPTQGGELDLGSLLGKFQSNGLASLASSFLGDGANDSFSASQILDMFGEQKVEQFSSQLNLEKGEAAGGLAGMIPELIDKNSKGGSLLGALGGSAAKGLMGKLFS